MSGVTRKIEIEELVLANVGDDLLQQDFAECLAEVGAVFSDPEQRFEVVSGKVKAEVTLKVTFEKDESSNVVVMAGQVSMKLPKRKARARLVQLLQGGLYTEPGTGEQAPLPMRPGREATE